MGENKWAKPQEVDGLTVAFGPSRVSDLLPSRDEIPEEFKRHDGTPWNRAIAAWFFLGIHDIDAKPKPGVVINTALRHIGSVLRSWEPQQEHKEAGCAYLLSLWFDEFKYR